MKKMIILLMLALMAISMASMAQTTSYFPEVIAKNITITQDTTFSVKVPDLVSWNFFVKVTTVGDSVKLFAQTGPNGTDWTTVNLSGPDTLVLVDPGKVTIEDPLGLSAFYLQLSVEITSTAKMTIWRTFKRSK
jgi:hypothetical protein